MTDYEKQFLIEYFKEMRSEIILRIGEHQKLVATKVISCGALLSFLLTKDLDEIILICGFIFIPIISMLYDIMIAKNVRCIHRIAIWIKKVIEPKLSHDKELWEKYCGQRDIKSRNYGNFDILFLSIFSAVTILIPVLIIGIKHIYFAIGCFIGLFSLQGVVIHFMKKCFLFFDEPCDIEKV